MIPGAMDQIAPETFAARRRSILDALPKGAALLLPTGSEQTRSADTHYPFRPDSNFYYTTGFPEPDAWALLRNADSGPEFVMFVNLKDPEREIWTGIRAGIEGATERYGADAAFGIDDLEKELAPLLESIDDLHFAFGRHPAVELRLNAILSKLRQGRKAGLGPVSLSDPGAVLSEMRLHKTDDEIAMHRRGAAITDEAHRQAMAQVRPGMHEYEIQALIEYTFRRRGAWGWAYPSIVGGGTNACVLHYIENSARFQDGDLMLVDAGAEVDGYATDVTRTSPVSGRFSGPQRALYELVLTAQVAACEAAVPGATIDDVHELAVRILTEGMIDLGLIEGPIDDAIEKKAFRRYYMHRTSHWLGLDVHDVGRYQLPGGPARPLEPGMIITVEPGLYIPPTDDQAPKAFRGIGIRIEDDLLITESGNENLTIAIPKTIEDIEALRD
jgi:Xaa-Pro aminopeptidase